MHEPTAREKRTNDGYIFLYDLRNWELKQMDPIHTVVHTHWRTYTYIVKKQLTSGRKNRSEHFIFVFLFPLFFVGAVVYRNIVSADAFQCIHTEKKKSGKFKCYDGQFETKYNKTTLNLPRFPKLLLVITVSMTIKLKVFFFWGEKHCLNPHLP